jgi:hypothetical protein
MARNGLPAIKKKIVHGMISNVQSYTNLVRSSYCTVPFHMLELLRHSNGSHSCSIPMQVYNSICILIRTLRSDCIGNTVLATATLWRESTCITCPVNPYWQITASLSFRNINYAFILPIWSVHSNDSSQDKEQKDNVRMELTLRSVRVTIVAVENGGKYTHS